MEIFSFGNRLSNKYHFAFKYHIRNKEKILNIINKKGKMDFRYNFRHLSV